MSRAIRGYVQTLRPEVWDLTSGSKVLVRIQARGYEHARRLDKYICVFAGSDGVEVVQACGVLEDHKTQVNTANLPSKSIFQQEKCLRQR